MSEITNTEVGSAVALAAKPFVAEVAGVPFVMLPGSDGEWTFHNHGKLLPAPQRKTGNITTHDVDSFIDVVKRHGSLSDCNIYLDVNYAANKVNAKAVFNDHGDGLGQPGWQDFTATFAPSFSEEWKRWQGNNKRAMEQVEFAHFLEENIGDITTPDGTQLPTGADVLTFVSKLEETRKVKYGSGVNLQNGMVQLEFIEEGDNGTKGRLELFKEFAIGIRPFFNGDAYSIRALLRHRIDRNNGQIKFWFELQRPDRVLEDASKSVIERIKGETGQHIIFGTLG